MGLRNLLVRVGADLSGLQRGMKQAQTQVNGFAQKASKSMKMVKVAMAAVGSALVIGPAIKDASKFEAQMGTLGESLGSSMKDFIKWQNTVGSSLGFSKLQSAELANTLSLNFKQIATSQKDLMNKTTKMMETAALIANKRGMAMSEVSDRIRSAMNQEADGADELGVNVRVSAIQQSKAYKEMANGKPWSDLSTNMQKAILYHHILQSVNANLGDTLQNNTAMKMSAFTASLQDTKLALGQAFLPILNVVLPVLTSFMRKIEGALQYVAAFSRALFGKTDVSGIQKQTKATKQQTNAVSGLGTAIKDTAKEAKKASRGVAGFDEINQLADPASSGSTGSSGGSSDVTGGDGGITPIIDPDSGKESAGILESISKKAKKLAQSFKSFFKSSAGWDSLKDAWNRFNEALSEHWNSKWMKSYVKWLKGGWKAGIDGILMIVAGAVDILAGAIEICTSVLNGDWKKAWSGVGKILQGFWEVITGTIGPLFPGLTKKMKDFGDNFFKKWNEIVDFDFGKLAENVIKVINKIKDMDWSDIKKLFKDTWKVIWGYVTNPFENAGTWFKTNVTDKISGSLSDGTFLKNIFNGASSIYTKIKSAFTEIKKTFVSKFSGITSALVDSTFLKNIFNGASSIYTKIKSAFTEIKKTFTTKFSGITSALLDSNFLKGIKSAASNIWGKITGVFTNVKSWFKTNVSDQVSSALKLISWATSDGFKGVITVIINKGIDLINGMLAKLNKALQYIDGHLLPGNAIPDIKPIPRLAKGGITNGPTLAMIGDNPGGREVVSPLDDLQDIVASAVGTAVMQAMKFSQSNSGTGGDINLNIDGRTFARIVKPYLEKEQKRVGKNLKLNSI
jgi:hypothetical protein